MKYLAHAICLHVLIFAAFALQLGFHKTYSGEKSNSVLQGYFYPVVHHEASNEKKSQTARLHKIHKIPALVKLDERENNTKNLEQNNLTSHINPISAGDSDVQNGELQKILHEAISAKQSYPESAQLLNQEGIVRIRFLLRPEGVLENVVIEKSSGFASIDDAALTAAKAISPVRQAHLYLKTAKLFSVDIRFSS